MTTEDPSFTSLRAAQVGPGGPGAGAILPDRTRQAVLAAAPEG